MYMFEDQMRMFEDLKILFLHKHLTGLILLAPTVYTHIYSIRKFIGLGILVSKSRVGRLTNPETLMFSVSLKMFCLNMKIHTPMILIQLCAPKFLFCSSHHKFRILIRFCTAEFVFSLSRSNFVHLNSNHMWIYWNNWHIIHLHVWCLKFLYTDGWHRQVISHSCRRDQGQGNILKTNLTILKYWFKRTNGKSITTDGKRASKLV